MLHRKKEILGLEHAKNKPKKKKKCNGFKDSIERFADFMSCLKQQKKIWSATKCFAWSHVIYVQCSLEYSYRSVFCVCVFNTSHWISPWSNTQLKWTSHEIRFFFSSLITSRDSVLFLILFSFNFSNVLLNLENQFLLDFQNEQSTCARSY